jgi:hypothetical protein
MPTDEEKLEQIERTVRDERARAAELKTRIDALDLEVEPPQPVIDHANDGGVI